MNLMAGRQLLLSSLWKASTKETGSEDVVDVEAAGLETPVAVETGDAQIEWKPAAKRFCPTDSLAESLPAPVVSPAVVDDTPVSTTCTSFDVNSLLGKYLTDNDRAEWIDKKDIVKLLQKTPASQNGSPAKKNHPRDPSGYAAVLYGSLLPGKLDKDRCTNEKWRPVVFLEHD